LNQISGLLPTWLPVWCRGIRPCHRAFDVALGLITVVLMATSLAPTTLLGQEPAVAEQDSAALAQDSLDVPEEVEQVTDERAAQDEAIRNQLQAVFDRVPDLARVEVTVDAGVVHLEGTVLRSETRTRAGELAAEMDGVLFLNNRIQESTSLEEQLQPTWTRLRELGFGALAKLPLVLVALIIVTLAGFAGSWLARWGGPKSLRLDNPFLQSLLQRFLRFVVILAALLLALDLLNATTLVGALVGTAGLAGIALGFAFKDIVENYLAGTILALRQPFEKNDLIRVEGFEGKVVRLTARETILMNLDGDHVRLPNALILRSPMMNLTRNPFEGSTSTRESGPPTTWPWPGTWRGPRCPASKECSPIHVRRFW
jgi:small conductance mechanosensitive channel